MVTNQLITVGVLFFFSIVGSMLSRKFRQPFVLGLLIVGALIGPHALNIVNDEQVINLMIEFGSILFLFVIGLEFSVKELLKTGVKSLLLAFFKMGVMFFIGYVAIVAFGMDSLTAIFVAVIVSFSSTIISMNILKQRGLIKRKEIPLLLAVLIIEDIVGVVFLNVFAGMSNGQASVLANIEHIVFGLGILIFAYIVISTFAEKVVRWLFQNTSDEMLMFIALDLCVGFALLAFALDLSPAAGAFLAGSVVANFRESKPFGKVIRPHSFMFTTLFFIAIGTLVNIRAIFPNLLLIFLLCAIMIIGMFFSVGIVSTILAGFDNESAAFSSVAMMPMGVFSLLIAKESMNFGIGVDLVTVTSVTMFILAFTTSIFITKTKELSLYLPKKKKNSTFTVFSEYISCLFEEFYIESRYTREFKKEATWLLVQLSILIFTAVLVSKLFVHFFGVSSLRTIFLVIGGLLLVSTWFIMLGAQSKKTAKLLVLIATHMDKRGDHLQAKAILTYTGLGMLFVLLGLFEPLFIFVFSLSSAFVLLGILFIGIGLFFLYLASFYLKRYAIKKEQSPHQLKKISL